MDELKAIIELIESLGGSATTAFIWYLIFRITSSLIVAGASVGVVLIVARTILASVKHGCEHEVMKLDRSYAQTALGEVQHLAGGEYASYPSINAHKFVRALKDLVRENRDHFKEEEA